MSHNGNGPATASVYNLTPRQEEIRQQILERMDRYVRSQHYGFFLVLRGTLVLIDYSKKETVAFLAEQRFYISGHYFQPEDFRRHDPSTPW